MFEQVVIQLKYVVGTFWFEPFISNDYLQSLDCFGKIDLDGKGRHTHDCLSLGKIKK